MLPLRDYSDTRLESDIVKLLELTFLADCHHSEQNNSPITAVGAAFAGRGPKSSGPHDKGSLHIQR